jgi:hypothetical protein
LQELLSLLVTGGSFTTSTESYTLSNINLNKYYFFWVTAVVDSVMETPKQNQGVMVFSASSAVDAVAVAGVNASIVDGKVELKWTANAAAEKGYKVYKMVSDYPTVDTASTLTAIKTTVRQ